MTKDKVSDDCRNIICCNIRGHDKVPTADKGLVISCDGESLLASSSGRRAGFL